MSMSSVMSTACASSRPRKTPGHASTLLIWFGTADRPVLFIALVARLLPQGTVSYRYAAVRVMEFPLGVYGTALAPAVLPCMAAHVARGERRALPDMLGFSLRLPVFVPVAAAVGLVAL